MRAEQRLVQSPQMIQAMQVLQLPLMELKDQIEQELQENVFLHVCLLALLAFRGTCKPL